MAIDFDSNIPFTREDVDKIAKQTGMITPFHIYDERGIVRTAESLNDAFSWVKEYNPKGFQNYFAVKALPNPRILEILSKKGMGADCSSMPELDIAKMVGLGGEDVMFTSNDTPDEEFSRARELGVIINLDDRNHVESLERAIGGHGNFPEMISFRYNPGPAIKGNDIIGDPTKAKYGVPDEQIIDAYSLARMRGATRFGLHSMMVSNERSEKALIEQSRILFDVAARIHRELGIEFEFINLGGGIGIPYRPEDHELDVAAFAGGVKDHYERIILGNNMAPPRVVTESGRAITGPHGWLVSRVRHVDRKYRELVGLDSCMANLMRPGMYSDGLDPEGECYHHVTVLGKEQEPKDYIYDVTGSLCEGCDVFARQRPLPKTERGDIVVVHTTGAHGHSMGFNYNGKLKSGEILQREDGSFETIRRPETGEDYFATLDFPGSKYVGLARETAF
tara:strand:- start:1643 stop:2992 length:1350 start_codon:yes stop_codon:yes gene_type:complete